MFKNSSLKKFYLAQVIILCTFTISIIGVFFYMNKKIDASYHKQEMGVTFKSFMQERYTDHLYWLTALRKHVYEGRPFNKATNPTKYGFGRGYDGYKLLNPEEAAIYKAIEVPHRRLYESALAILKANDIAKKKAIFLTVSEPAASEIKKIFDKYKAHVDEMMIMGYEAMGSLVRVVEIFVIAVMIILCGITIDIFLISHNKLFKPLTGFSNVITSVSKGDFTVNTGIAAKDEIGCMAEKMVSNLRQMIQRITQGTHQVASASEELSATAEYLNRGTQEQSSQTDQVASAMAEMSQTIMDVAKNAGEALGASKDASSIAFKGKDSVAKTVQGMLKIAETVKVAASTIEELGRSSNEIGNIVKVIDDIADQTNLLALNAAIEAARAGEQGRGFAVVADEVRKLAERTGKATKEIAGMIKKIQAETEKSVSSMNAGKAEVESGVKLVKEADASLDMIVNASDKSVDMIQRIAVATEEQSTASEEVSQNMDSISSITKKSAEATKQIKQASDDLARFASELQAMTGWFKVEAQGKGAVGSGYQKEPVAAGKGQYFFEPAENKDNGGEQKSINNINEEVAL